MAQDAHPPHELRRPVAAWPARLAVVATIALYLVLPRPLQLGPSWVFPTIELALLIPLSVTSLRFRAGTERLARALAVALLAVVNLANGASATLLARHLIARSSALTGHELVIASLSIWFTNVIAFGLWYWELDRGGPFARWSGAETMPDLLFPQMTSPQFAPPDWRPGFMDYLYVALTNAAAFSPTDTMPLSRTAKALMSLQSLISLVTVVVVAARAINVL